MEKDLVKDGATFSAGLMMRWGINHGFDYVVYPTVIAAFGSVHGGIMLTVFATICNVFLIRAYDWSKTDWLLIEKLKSKVQADTHTGFKQYVYRFIRKNNILMFFILNLDDPITATLYLRKGYYQYNGMNKRDWIIFICSNILSNLYWVIGWTAVIEIFKTAITYF